MTSDDDSQAANPVLTTFGHDLNVNVGNGSFKTDDSLLEWAVKAQPTWSSEKLIPWDEAMFQKISPFVKSESWTALDTINLFSVVGTRTSSYYHWSWLKFIQEGKRMSNINLPLYASNPVYYDGVEAKLPPMSFITLDGENLFIDADGNHRTCVARFAFARDGRTQLHGVGVKRLTVDWELYGLSQEIARLVSEKSLKVHVEGTRSELGREDSAGWKVDRFDPILTIKDFRRNGLVTKLTAAQASQWISINSKSFFARLFKR
jgi:hypothetical protein